MTLIAQLSGVDGARVRLTRDTVLGRFTVVVLDTTATPKTLTFQIFDETGRAIVRTWTQAPGLLATVDLTALAIPIPAVHSQRLGLA